MNKENPFDQSPSEGEPIAGEGFTMHEQTPEEKKKSEQRTWNQELKNEVERTKGWTAADHAKDMLDSMLKSHNPYSETFKIKSDGKFDKIIRMDGDAVYLGIGASTPQELYQTAQEIQSKNPEYKFDFQTDPEGKWMKYTVSKTEKAN